MSQHHCLVAYCMSARHPLQKRVSVNNTCLFQKQDKLGPVVSALCLGQILAVCNAAGGCLNQEFSQVAKVRRGHISDPQGSGPSLFRLGKHCDKEDRNDPEHY